MDVRDMFLDQHAAMHSAAVGGNKMSASERTFASLSELLHALGIPVEERPG